MVEGCPFPPRPLIDQFSGPREEFPKVSIEPAGTAVSGAPAEMPSAAAELFIVLLLDTNQVMADRKNIRDRLSELWARLRNRSS